MHRNFLITGIIFAGTAVAIGAFGAHGLQKLTTDTKIIEAFKTGVQYQFWHALALLIAGILFERYNSSLIKWAGRCFIAGILLFSGSLYVLSILKINANSLAKLIGPVTPIGGLLLIIGWVLLLLSVWKRR